MLLILRLERVGQLLKRHGGSARKSKKVQVTSGKQGSGGSSGQERRGGRAQEGQTQSTAVRGRDTAAGTVGAGDRKTQLQVKGEADKQSGMRQRASAELHNLTAGFSAPECIGVKELCFKEGRQEAHRSAADP